MGFLDDLNAQLPGGSAGGLLGNTVGGITSIISNPVGQLTSLAGTVLGGTGLTGGTGGALGIGGAPGAAGGFGIAGVGLGAARAGLGWIWRKVGFSSFKEFAKYAAGSVGISIAYDALFGEDGPPAAPEGKSTTITIVRRVYENGYMENVSTEEGHPVLMSRDYQKAKRVQRTVGKMYNRMPRRTVKQSNASKAKEAVEKAIIDKVTCDVPKKGCC